MKLELDGNGGYTFMAIRTDLSESQMEATGIHPVHQSIVASSKVR
jgi:hypothetical protein